MKVNRNILWWIGVPTLVLACDGCNFGLQTTPLTSDAPPREIALAGAAVLVGTGDIAVCGDTGDERTAHVVDSLLRVYAAAGAERAVFTLGDHAYPAATERQLQRCFGPSWGDPAKEIMGAIRPSIGNHDYEVQGGAPYYRYFGDRAGQALRGYYSYALGDWHVVVLNSELAVHGTPAEVKLQEDWLEQDLTANGKFCTVAYFHRPLFTSSFRQGNAAMRRLWEILYASNVDLVLSGHDHHYERFHPQDPSGVVDTVRGIEQIIVGTGGATLRGFRSRFGFRDPRIAPNSAMRIQGRFGVLEVVLAEDEYHTVFIEADGRTWDRSGRKCH